MKNSGIDSFGEIPEEWQTVKLKYLFNFSRGLNITKSDFIDNGVKVVTYGDIHSRYGFRVNPTVDKLNSVSFSYFEKMPDARLNRGDFVFADTSEDIKGSGDFTCFDSDNQCMAGYHTIVLKPKEKLNYKYLAYLFDSFGFRYQIQQKVSGVKVYSINQNILKNIFALLPSKSEQKMIADFLSAATIKINKIISFNKQSIEELNSYKQSLITEAVTKGLDHEASMKDSGIDWIGSIPENWEIVKLKYVADLQTGSTPPTKKLEYFNGDVTWYKPGDLKDTFLLEQSNDTLTIQAIKDNKATLFPENTIYFVGIGATVGKIGYSINKAYCNQQITALIAKYIQPKYLLFLLQTANEYIKSNALYTTLPIINNNYLGNIKLPLPNLDTQKKIVKYLETKLKSIDQIIEDKNKLIEELENYNQSLIYEYVTGKKEV